MRSRIFHKFEFEFRFFNVNEFEFDLRFFKINEFKFEFRFFKTNKFEFKKLKNNEWIQPCSRLVDASWPSTMNWQNNKGLSLL